MASEFIASIGKMKRYLNLIPILAILVLASGITAGCSQKQEKQELRELIYYIDRVDSIAMEYLAAQGAVWDADKVVLDVLQSRDEYRLLEVYAARNTTINRALETVDSGLLFLKKGIPPSEAGTLQRLMVQGLEKAQSGLTKLSHARAVAYDEVYSMLHRSVPKSEYPDTSGEITQGTKAIGEAIDLIRQASIESGRLFQSVKQRIIEGGGSIP